MGRIKSKLIKRTGRELLEDSDKFSDNFDSNKRVLSGTMPSKKIRNQLAMIGTKDSTFDEIVQKLLEKWNEKIG